MVTKFIFGLLVALFLFVFTMEADADILYLKNGRSIEGLIKKEDESIIELDVGFGTVKFNKREVVQIERSTPGESRLIHKKWEKEKLEREKKDAQLGLKKELQPRDVDVSQQSGHIFVDAILNKKVKVRLLLDTGASLVVLPKEIGKKLKISSKVDKESIELELVDGRKINAKYVLLENISVQGVEAKDVDAAILLDSLSDINFEDGLLGMSFLNKFNFKIDSKNNKLILEKLR